MLVPGSPADLIQIIDVRDLANFVVDSLEQKITGTYNMVTPPGSYSMGEFMADCQAVAASDTSLTWVDLPFIEANGLTTGGELPIWAPMSGDTRSDAIVNGDRSFAKGMKTRPPRETIRDILDWWPTLPEDRRNDLRAGMGAEREIELLAAWHDQNAL